MKREGSNPSRIEFQFRGSRMEKQLGGVAFFIVNGVKK